MKKGYEYNNLYDIKVKIKTFVHLYVKEHNKCNMHKYNVF